MFGSNFFANFGLPDFPYQGMDPQGGMLGNNIDLGMSPAGPTAAPGGAAPAGGIAAPQAAAPAAPQGNAAGASPLGPSSPLAPTPPRMSDPGPAPQQLNDVGGPMQPPAAGIASPFGRPQL